MTVCTHGVRVLVLQLVLAGEVHGVGDLHVVSEPRVDESTPTHIN